MALKPNNFVIAALGSSGTQFLAQLMNRSERWHVLHMGLCQSFDLDGTTPVTVQPLLDARPRCFGDVNGLLLYHLQDLVVARKAVIIRHPHDTLLSWYCEAQGRLQPSFFSIYAGGYFALDDCIEHGITCIRFERMVTDAGYLRRILRWFGIRDVEPSKETLGTKVNAKRSPFCASYEAIDAATRARFERASATFARKYYGDEPLPHADDFADVDPDAPEEPDEADGDDGELPARADVPKWAATRSTTLCFAGNELPSRLLPPAAIERLAGRLALRTPRDQGLAPRLDEVRVFRRSLTLLVVGGSALPQRVLLEDRREGAPYLVRTRHLHLSVLGPKPDQAARELLAALAERLGDTTLDQLWPAE